MIYKSVLYINTFFVLNNHINDENVNIIINALNIKGRKKRIEYVYDQACDMIDKKVGVANICGFENGKCFVQRKLKNGKCNGCCRKCLYQSKTGCSTKNLACKLFNCSEVTSRYEVIKYRDIMLFKILSLKNRLIVKSDFFSKREDVLKDLYCYTITWSTIRIVFRLMKNRFIIKRKLLKVEG